MTILRRLRFQYPWLFLVILVAFFALTTAPFPHEDNFLAILRSVAIIGLFALGNAFVLIGGGVDVSVVSVGATTAMLYARLFQDGMDTESAVALALVFAAGLGLINGILVTKGRIAPFIATLASGSVFNALTERISGGFSIYDLGEQHKPPEQFFATFGRGELLGVPVQVIILGGVALGSFFLLTSTIFGRHLYAAGANPRAARLSGVNVDRVRLATYVICALFAGLAGLIRASELGHAERTGATVYTQGTDLLDSIGAVLIGGATLSGGIGTVEGTIAGALIIGVLDNGLKLHGVDEWVRYLSSGVVIIAAVAVGSLLSGNLPLRAEIISGPLGRLFGRIRGRSPPAQPPPEPSPTALDPQDDIPRVPP